MTHRVFLLRLGSILFSLSLFLHATQAFAQAQQEDLYRDAMIAISEGRTADAQRLLKSLIDQQPLHAGASLELAMLYCATSDALEAEKLFKEIEQRFAPPPAIQEVIRQQRLQGCHGWQAKSSMALRVGYGNESNVNQGARNSFYTFDSGTLQMEVELQPMYLPRPDRFSLSSFEFTRELSQNGAVGFIQLQSRKFQNLSDFNSDAISAGVELPWEIEKWRILTLGSVGTMSLGHSTYQQQNHLQVEATPPLPLPKSWRVGLIQGIRSVKYPTLSGFDAHWLEEKASLTYENENAQVQMLYGRIDDIPSGTRPGGERSGNVGSISLITQIHPKISAEAAYQSQRWVGSSIYSPGLINLVRSQRNDSFRLAVNYQISNEHSATIEYREVKNRENISLFEFNSKQIMLSWQWRPMLTK